MPFRSRGGGRFHLKRRGRRREGSGAAAARRRQALLGRTQSRRKGRGRAPVTRYLRCRDLALRHVKRADRQVALVLPAMRLRHKIMFHPGPGREASLNESASRRARTPAPRPRPTPPIAGAETKREQAEGREENNPRRSGSRLRLRLRRPSDPAPNVGGEEVDIRTDRLRVATRRNPPSTIYTHQSSVKNDSELRLNVDRPLPDTIYSFITYEQFI